MGAADDEAVAGQEAAFHDGIKHRSDQERRAEDIKKQGKATRRKALFT